MLRHVPFDGWSETAMQTTAEELGMPAPMLLILSKRPYRANPYWVG